MGYYLHYEYRQVQARRQLREYLDKNHQTLLQEAVDEGVKTGQWVRFAVPLEFYHQTDRSLMPTEGEFRVGGKVYEKAMSGIRNDTMYVYCINNRMQEQVQRNLSDHIKTHLVDYTGTPPEKNQKTLKFSLLQEYLPTQATGLPINHSFVRVSHPVGNSSSFSSRATETAVPPPRQV